MRFRIIKSGGYYREQIKRWWGWQNLHMAAETTPEACERNIRRYLDHENEEVVKEFVLTEVSEAERLANEATDNVKAAMKNLETFKNQFLQKDNKMTENKIIDELVKALEWYAYEGWANRVKYEKLGDFTVANGVEEPEIYKDRGKRAKQALEELKKATSESSDK